jgi:hypothetical protein
MTEVRRFRFSFILLPHCLCSESVSRNLISLAGIQVLASLTKACSSSRLEYRRMVSTSVLYSGSPLPTQRQNRIEQALKKITQFIYVAKARSFLANFSCKLLQRASWLLNSDFNGFYSVLLVEDSFAFHICLLQVCSSRLSRICRPF